MQITVRSSKVAKTGTNDKGTWSLIVVVAEDTGIEYTTFDKKAHIGAGAVLDIGEPVIKEGKHSFKNCEIVSEPAALLPAEPESRPGMTPELWAEKDRLERWSRECNTCFMGLSQVVSSVYAKPDGEIPEYIFDVYGQALDWARAHFKPASKSVNAGQAEKDIEELWTEPVEEPINMDWLKESLKTLREKNLKGWDESNLLSYMKINYKVEAPTVLECAAKLKKGSATHFVKRVQETLEMA